MERELDEAWSQFLLSHTDKDGLALARMLLMLYPLEYYEQEALNAYKNLENSDPDIILVLPYFRAISYPEASKAISDLSLIPNSITNHTSLEHWYDLWFFQKTFSNVQPESERSESTAKFINVYWGIVPIATVSVKNYQELKTILPWIRNFYSGLVLLPPPKQISLETIRNTKYFFVYTYEYSPCQNYTISTDDKPAFQLERESSPPIYKYQHGKAMGHMRPITEEDYVSTDLGNKLINFEYSLLPDFAKPEVVGTPQYLLVGTTTREQVGGFSSYGDEGEWANFTTHFAKIYLGYFENLLHSTSESERWSWQYVEYEYHCDNCGYQNNGEVDDIMERCPQCRNYWNRIVSQTPQIIPHPDHPNTPPPPLHLNTALDFFQKTFDYINHGNIYSVRGGEQLSLSISEEYYGPEI